MAVNPMTRTFLWAERGGGGMNDSGPPNSDMPEASYRKIIHTGFEGNPRFSGGIEMQLPKEDQNNLFRRGVAGSIADSLTQWFDRTALIKAFR
jgi:hypothetical protein